MSHFCYVWTSPTKGGPPTAFLPYLERVRIDAALLQVAVVGPAPLEVAAAAAAAPGRRVGRAVRGGRLLGGPEGRQAEATRVPEALPGVFASAVVMLLKRSLAII